MTKSMFTEKRRVTIDGIDLTWLVDISIGNMGVERETFNCHDDVYDHDIDLPSKYVADGSITVKGIDNNYGNDPMTALDFFSQLVGFAQYDTATGVVAMTYDSKDQTTTGLMDGKRTIEIRQVEATASTTIDDDATEEAMAQQFIAAGEEITAIKLKLREPVGTDLNSFDLEIWSDDGSDKPSAKVASTNTVTVNCSAGSDDETNDYIGALTEHADYTGATWETIDMSASTPDILDGEELTVGTKYWLVIRNTVGAGEDLGICYTTNSNTDNGLALGDDDIGTGPVWGDAPAGITDLTYIIQFEAAEGHEIIIYDYKDSTSGYYWKFEGVCFPDGSVNPSPKQSTEFTINWTAQSMSGPTAFS